MAKRRKRVLTCHRGHPVAPFRQRSPRRVVLVTAVVGLKDYPLGPSPERLIWQNECLAFADGVPSRRTNCGQAGFALRAEDVFGKFGLLTLRNEKPTVGEFAADLIKLGVQTPITDDVSMFDPVVVAPAQTPRPASTLGISCSAVDIEIVADLDAHAFDGHIDEPALRHIEAGFESFVLAVETLLARPGDDLRQFLERIPSVVRRKRRPDDGANDLVVRLVPDQLRNESDRCVVGLATAKQLRQVLAGDCGFQQADRNYAHVDVSHFSSPRWATQCTQFQEGIFRSSDRAGWSPDVWLAG
jgi:hypothetical protein